MKKYNFKVLREGLLKFVVAHPRLTTVLAGVGITVAFASVGRFAVHEALATTASPTSFNDLTYNVPNDHITSFQPDTLPQGASYHKVAISVFCSLCAPDFAPGHEATSPGDAQNFAPGHEANSEIPAKDFAPGQEFKKGIK